MTYKDAVKEFKRNLRNGEYDYWTVQEMWSAYTDAMCKAGEITQKQWSTWATPFEYGKRILVYDEKVITQK
ncbi:MAG: hypothetical protein J6O49_01515 [Bacteroidaceae bacterium]|nr:hypothetical protein [Bacteroidaceae bacterium]